MRIRLNPQFFVFSVLIIVSLTAVADPIGAGETPECGDPNHQHILVIPVKNSLDDPGQIITVEQLESKYFGDNNSLKDFWDEVSYGKIDVSGDVVDWVTVEERVQHLAV